MRISSKRRSDWMWAYIMITPLMLGLLVFYIWPVFQTFYFSFTDWGSFGKYTWSGLSNYKKLFTDKDLLYAFRNTSIYIITAVPIGIILSIILAVLLNQKVKGLSVYRTLYFLPVVTMPAAVAMVWKWLYNSDFGLINYVLSRLSIPGPHWLTDNRTALLSIIIVAIWSSIGSHMIIFLSGLQGISESYYEAASIDGAGAFTKFTRITMPLLTPTIFFVMVTSLIGAFQVFDFIYMMVGDIVMESTQSIVFLYYKYGFLKNAKGYASSIAVLLFAIIMVITYIQMKIQKKWVHYE
ncbi:carbohydrate ABC transporter permease [Paenibacillus aceris]|uniref:Multiple sugar transport system permease protein n=1 Tax=Paenibacillus aceris TaxID=869555 RepID=A0ABS4I0J8_9BACL|nr:sugar ABC transporter permease [Paenibacillus aceris]MBP1964444.1 multiple sugar transport system permease protein [Paenibacillus aceris]NHW35843.1 sugar ABC transporter permease [Paenibacillus aceris]